MLKKIENIYKQEKNKLLSFIKSRTGNIEEAEDIFHDIFYKAILNMNSLESVDNLIGWFYTVAKNKIIDSYRKKNRSNISFDVIGENEFIEDLFNVSETLDNEMLIEKVMVLINKLPDKQKFVFIQTEIEGQSFKKLSKITGDSINTLISRKRYAIQFIKNNLKKED